MDTKRIILVCQRRSSMTSSSFNVTLATPLYLQGSWTCQVQSVSLAYSNTFESVGLIPNPLFIVCDFVESAQYNDTYFRFLSVCHLDPNKEKGYNSVNINFFLPRQVKVVKDYISHVQIDILDQRLRPLPHNFLRSDIVLELLFTNNV